MDPVVYSVDSFDPVDYAYAVDPVPVDPVPAPATVVVELASVPRRDPKVDEAAPIAESEAARASVEGAKTTLPAPWRAVAATI